MNTPAWHAIALLGDVNPVEHGGKFVLVDKLGVYTPILWCIVENECEKKVTTYNVELTRCYECKGCDGITNNIYHMHSSTWFGDDSDIYAAASTNGIDSISLKRLLVHSEPIERARGYECLVNHYGYANFDSYPYELSVRDARKISNRLKTQIAQSSNWINPLVLTNKRGFSTDLSKK